MDFETVEVSKSKIPIIMEEGCYYLLFDSRTHRGANQQVRDWVSYVLYHTNLVYFAEEQ